MTRRNKLIILAVYLLLLAVALPLYHMKRSVVKKRIRAEIAATQNEINRIKATEQEAIQLQKLFPTDADTSSFVEDLYSAAKLSGLTAHETSSDTQGNRPLPRGSIGSDLSRYRYKTRVEGTYRSIAEYIRRVQNLERFKRITEIKLAPAAKGISGDISLELYSLKGQNAPQ